jgi:hypothetical protein
MSTTLTEPYLRVLTPETTDGMNLKYVETRQGTKQVFKETHLPITAKKSLEKENLKRPKQLQHVIEIVGELPAKKLPQPKH